ncbi:MAG: type IV pilus secretin PilQ [Gammaproteobacteria bacterium]|nr:type IV pilus secretin PilQ [Gammaproteobacteria bacterium]NNC97933.1 type IV pilus secretin PilQ [Gammaproteobacteria bacterium]NNM14269.1 type IV pilus secretin PilQ [Gammaproteobacteria bacterium]
MPLSAGQLQNVSVVDMSNNTVEVRFQLDSAAPQPLSFTIDSPARIALDLPDTTLGNVKKRKSVDVGVLNSILAAEANGRTRIVLNLDSMQPYKTRTEGNDVILTLGGGANTNYSPAFNSEAVVSSPAPAQSNNQTTSPDPVSYSSGYSANSGSINDIDFRRGEDGAGRIVVNLADASTKVDISEEAGKIVATFQGAGLPPRLQQRMDVIDFGTPVTTVDSITRDGNTRMLISAKGDYDQLVYQSENVFTIEIREKIKVPTELQLLEEREYTGTPINLNFQSIDVRAVLQVLASNGDFNLVVSDSVTGNVTLRLQNVPWDQALDIVLQTKGLDKRTKDNVILVAPAAELSAQEQQKLQAIKDLEQLAPLRSDIVQINYAKAADIKALLEEGSGSGEDSTSFLSSRGSATVDERTNTLLIYDTSDKLEEIRELIEVLDIPVTQVLIESRVVVANTDFSRELGVRAGFSSLSDNSPDGLISVAGTNNAAVETINSINPDDGSFEYAADRLNVNLPVASPAGSIGVAILNGSYLVDLELSALQAEGRGEIISSPRVTATNQKEASILQGVEIPFQNSAGGGGGATTTQFKEAVLSMKVTPLITPDDYIIMDLEISQDSIGELVPGSNGGFIPSIDTRELITEVRIKNGETAVLGGIYETEAREGSTKVPVLGDLPVLGGLFRTKSKDTNKSEMLIFISPKIMNDKELDL